MGKKSEGGAYVSILRGIKKNQRHQKRISISSMEKKIIFISSLKRLIAWELPHLSTRELKMCVQNSVFPGVSRVRNLPTVQEMQEMGPISRSGKSPVGRRGNPPQYSCLENLITEKPGRL